MEAVDRGEAFDVVYMDFARAFNQVLHTKLVKKPRMHGISGKVLGWVESWMTNQRQ